MSYKTKVLTASITAAILIGFMAIGMEIYRYEHSGTPRWGHSLMLIDMLLNMFVIITTCILFARHNQARKKQDAHVR